MLSKEFKLGLLATLAGFLFYFGFNFLKGIDMFSPNKTYHALFDRVDGLQTSNLVIIKGLSVGRVTNIALSPDDATKIVVTFDVEQGVILGDKTTALLRDNGLLGGRIIELKLEKEKVDLQDGDTLISQIDNGVMGLVEKNAAPMMKNADSLLVNLNQSMTTLVPDLVRIAHNGAILSDSLVLLYGQQRRKIASMLDNMNKLSASLVETEKSLKPLVGKMNTIADTVNAMQLASLATDTRKTINELQSTLKAINQAEGTAGKLVKDKQLYDNMNKTMQDLDSLLLDLKGHPKRYVHFSMFGKKDKKK